MFIPPWNWQMRDNPTHKSRTIHVPGFDGLVESDIMPSPQFLLIGQADSGKTMYCRQFLIDGLNDNCFGVFVTADMNEKQFQRLFGNAGAVDLNKIVYLSTSNILSTNKITSILLDDSEGTPKTVREGEKQDQAKTTKDLLILLERIQEILAGLRSNSKDGVPPSQRILFVFDSLSYLVRVFDSGT